MHTINDTFTYRYFKKRIFKGKFNPSIKKNYFLKLEIDL